MKHEVTVKSSWGRQSAVCTCGRKWRNVDGVHNGQSMSMIAHVRDTRETALATIREQAWQYREDVTQAFEEAIAAGRFTQREAEAGLIMYMGTFDGRDEFKHKVTREYVA
jgi:hypothetical protein